LNTNENHFQKVKAVYLAIKAHIKDFQEEDTSIKISNLSVFDLERLEKIYLWPHNIINLFKKIALQSPEAGAFRQSIEECSALQKAVRMSRWIGHHPEELNNISKLDLSGLNLSYVPEEIGYLTDLTDLNLAVNNLTFLPEEIGKLNKLQKL